MMSGSYALPILGVILLGATIFWIRNSKPLFHVQVGTSGLDQTFFSSKDKQLVDSVMQAISLAIVERG